MVLSLSILLFEGQLSPAAISASGVSSEIWELTFNGIALKVNYIHKNIRALVTRLACRC